MESSSALYEKQRQLITAKAQLNANVNKFISKCNIALSKANLIARYCADSLDTNLKASGASGGAIAQLVKGIRNVCEKVSSELSAANTKMQSDIDELGRQAREAAAREAAAKRASEKETTQETQ